MSKLIALQDLFTKQGRYVYKGQLLDEHEIDIDDTVKSPVVAAPADIDDLAVIQIAAIAPTGPNPQNPQQVPPGAHQTPAGYVQDGARLVGEVTQPAAKRFAVISDEDDNTQEKITTALDEAAAEAAETAEVKASKAKNGKAKTTVEVE